MIRRLLVLVLAPCALTVVLGAWQPASAECRLVQKSVIFHGMVKVRERMVCDEATEPEAGSGWELVKPSDPSEDLPALLRGSSSNLDCPGVFLHHAATGSLTKVGDGCAPEGQAPVITTGMIMNRFRNTPIPTPQIVVQPPGGKTLVNFETIFRTEADEFTESFRLLGQRIVLRISPSSFTWRPGDGTSFTTATPGIAFEEGRSMDDYVSHMYQAATLVHPRVDVTWGAEFRVGGGAWRSVPGTVTKQGTPADLRVVEGKPVLVDAY